jgi:uncharacterized protein
VNVAEIKLEVGGHKRVSVDFAMTPDDAADQVLGFPRPFTGQAEVWNLGDRLLVKGKVSGEVELQCSRCLAPVVTPLEASFEEEFVEGAEPQVEVQDNDAEEDSAEEARTVTYYAGEEIDLTDVLRDAILLELPMKPLCTEDCQGLCPTCGKNLNEGACQCNADLSDVDPRLSVLKDLLRRPDSQS